MALEEMEMKERENKGNARKVINRKGNERQEKERKGKKK